MARRGTFTPFLWSVARRRPWKVLYLPPILLAALAYKARLISRKSLKEFMLSRILGGVERGVVARFAQAFVDQCLERELRPGARAAIAHHKEAGDLLVLATASFDIYVEDLAKQLGFDSFVCTRAEFDPEGRLSGKILGENCYGEAKLRAIEQSLPNLAEKYHVIAYSDHHIDMPLLLWADRGVAVNPSLRLRKLAVSRGLSTIDWDLDA